MGEVAFLAGGHLDDIGAAGRPGAAPLELLPRDGEQVAGGDIPGGGEQVFGCLALLLDSSHEGGQQRELARVRWSIRDLTPDLDFLVAHSDALTGHGVTQRAQRAGSSAAQRAMSS